MATKQYNDETSAVFLNSVYQTGKIVGNQEVIPEGKSDSLMKQLSIVSSKFKSNQELQTKQEEVNFNIEMVDLKKQAKENKIQSQFLLDEEVNKIQMKIDEKNNEMFLNQGKRMSPTDFDKLFTELSEPLITRIPEDSELKTDVQKSLRNIYRNNKTPIDKEYVTLLRKENEIIATNDVSMSPNRIDIKDPQQIKDELVKIRNKYPFAFGNTVGENNNKINELYFPKIAETLLGKATSNEDIIKAKEILYKVGDTIDGGMSAFGANSKLKPVIDDMIIKTQIKKKKDSIDFIDKQSTYFKNVIDSIDNPYGNTSTLLKNSEDIKKAVESVKNNTFLDTYEKTEKISKLNETYEKNKLYSEVSVMDFENKYINADEYDTKKKDVLKELIEKRQNTYLREANYKGVANLASKYGLSKGTKDELNSFLINDTEKNLLTFVGTLSKMEDENPVILNQLSNEMRSDYEFLKIITNSGINTEKEKKIELNGLMTLKKNTKPDSDKNTVEFIDKIKLDTNTKEGIFGGSNRKLIEVLDYDEYKTLEKQASFYKNIIGDTKTEEVLKKYVDGKIQGDKSSNFQIEGLKEGHVTNIKESFKPFVFEIMKKQKPDGKDADIKKLADKTVEDLYMKIDGENVYVFNKVKTKFNGKTYVETVPTEFNTTLTKLRELQSKRLEKYADNYKQEEENSKIQFDGLNNLL